MVFVLIRSGEPSDLRFGSPTTQSVLNSALQASLPPCSPCLSGESGLALRWLGIRPQNGTVRALPNLRIAFLALLALILIGIAGFHYLEGWTWFEGFYMVLTTITTIGYGELHPLSPAGRVFNSFIIIAGVALVLLITGGAAQALLEFELQSVFGRRRMEREISRLSGHYIICGAGRVGRSVARELVRKPFPFVVIDTDEAKLKRYTESGWLTLQGDATHESVLRQARVEHAKGLVAATTTDAVNIYVILTARELNPKLKIIARASEESAEKHLLTAGADSVVSPYNFAGYRIAQTFMRPHVVDFLRHRDGPAAQAGDRGDSGAARLGHQRQDTGSLAPPPAVGSDCAGHQGRQR